MAEDFPSKGFGDLYKRLEELHENITQPNKNGGNAEAGADAEHFQRKQELEQQVRQALIRLLQSPLRTPEPSGYGCLTPATLEVRAFYRTLEHLQAQGASASQQDKDAMKAAFLGVLRVIAPDHPYLKAAQNVTVGEAPANQGNEGKVVAPGMYFCPISTKSAITDISLF